MADTLSKRKRSELMSRVRSADTKPEWVLRCGLHRMGFRFRLRNRKLPGRPDLIFPRYRAAVFVHGCFWHRHRGCREASSPKTNTPYWQAKFSENVRRDRLNRRKLEHLGWRVRVVWECELIEETGTAIRETAAWLVEGHPPPPGLEGRTHELDASRVLAVAETRLRYMLDGPGRTRRGAGRP